jgi:SAM-dependent methyltransferase
MTDHVSCPVCAGPEALAVLRRTEAPVFVNVTYPTAEDAMRAPARDMDVRYCPGCGLLFNPAYDPAALTFDGQYENDQGLSSKFAAHEEESIGRILRLLEGAPRVSVVEIGCGQGGFLRRLAARLDRPATLIGYDPALQRAIRSAGQHEETIGRADVRLVPRRFSAAEPIGDADAVLFLMRAVFEYMDAPLELLTELRRRAGRFARGLICLEITSLETILASRTLFDIYYEYGRYYGAASIGAALARAGWGAASATPVLDQRYLWVESSCEGEAKPLGRPLGAAEIRSLAAADEAMRSSWSDKIRDAAQKGPVAVWGGAGKGLNFVSMIDPDRRLIDCVIDINPLKQGRFTPRTGHPVVSPQTAVQRGVRSACVLNPIYRAEIARQVAGLGADIDLIL